MFWSKKGAELDFNCVCGNKTTKMQQFDLEALLSGNYAYECKTCGLVYDVWSDENQYRFIFLYCLLAVIIIIGIIFIKGGHI